MHRSLSTTVHGLLGLCAAATLMIAAQVFAETYPTDRNPEQWTDEALFVHPMPQSVSGLAYGKDREEQLRRADEIAAMTDDQIIACIPKQSPLIHNWRARDASRCPNHPDKRGGVRFDPARPHQYTCTVCGETFPNNPKYPINLTKPFYAPKLTEDGPLGKEHVAEYHKDEQGRIYCFQGMLETARNDWSQGAMSTLMRAYHNTQDEKYARKAAVFVDAYAMGFRDWVLVRSYGADYICSKGRGFPYGWTSTRYGRRASGEVGGPGNMLRVADVCWHSQGFKDYGERVGRDIIKQTLQTMEYARARYYGGFGKFHQGFPATHNFKHARVVNNREWFRAFAQCMEKFPQVSFTVDGGYTEGPGYTSIHLYKANNSLRRLNGYSDPEGYEVPADSYNARAWQRMFPQGDVPDQGLLKDYEFPYGKYEDFWKKAFTWTKKIATPAGPPPIFNDASYGSVTKAAFLRREPLKRSDDVMMPGLRHVLLGDGEGDQQVQVHMGFGISTNHGHQDTLDIQVFDNGHYLLDDYSYPKHRLRLTYSGAMGHNVVMVDHQNFRDALGDGNPHFYEPNLPGLSAVRVDSPRVYAGVTDQYSRTLLLNTVDIDQPYIVDLFVVEGGQTRDYFMRGGKTHGIRKQTTSLSTQAVPGLRPLLPEGVAWDEEQVDVVGDGYGVLFDVRKTSAPDYFYVDYQVQDTWDLPRRRISGNKHADDPRHFEEITGKTGWAKLPFKAFDDSWRDEPIVGLRHHFAVDGDYTAHLFEMPTSGGMDDDKPSHEWPRQPGFMLRHSGQDGRAVFVAVHEPYVAQTAIRSVSRLPVPRDQPNAVALQVSFTNGRQDVVLLSTNDEPIDLDVAGIEFNGRIGTVARHQGKADTYLIGGAVLKVKGDGHSLQQPHDAYRGVVSESRRTWNGDEANGFYVDTDQPLPESLVGSWIILRNDGEMINAREGQRRFGQGSLTGRREDFLSYKLKFVRWEIEHNLRNNGIIKPYAEIQQEALKTPLGRRVVALREEIEKNRELVIRTPTTWCAMIAGIEERDGRTFIRTAADHGLEIDGDKCHEYFFPQRWLEGAPVTYTIYPAISNQGRVTAQPVGGEYMKPVRVELDTHAAAPDARVQYALLPLADDHVYTSEIAWQTYTKPIVIDRHAKLVARSVTASGIKAPLYDTFAFRVAREPARVSPSGLAKHLKATGDDPHVADDLYRSMDEAGRRYVGYLRVPAEGLYTFHLRPRGDGRMKIGADEVLAYTGLSSTPMPRAVRVPLKKGFYPIEIESNRGIHELEWEGPGIERRHFKPDELFH